MSSDLYGEGLLAHHARLLEESGIDPRVARERRFQSVKTKTALAELGFKRGQCRVPALLVPVWDVWGEIVDLPGPSGYAAGWTGTAGQ